jgi:O-antigen/teichoic acid export membrane protein
MIKPLEIVRRLLQSRRLLRLTAFDTTTAEGRSDERHRRMLFSTLASVAAKLISISAALISVPLTLHYLGAERYGMWMTMSSFIAILSFADLGMGNGLLNLISSANGKDDRAAIQRYVSSGFGMLSLIAAVILAGFWISYSFVPWERLFNVRSPLAEAEAGPAIAVFAVCFALSIPAAIVQKVQIGLQNSFVASMWQGLGSLLALAGVLVATHLQLGLPWLVFAFVGAPLVAAIGNSLLYFTVLHPDIAPTSAGFSSSVAHSTARSGLLFLLLQVVAAASFSSDPLVISHLLGPAAVAQYSVPERMFSVIGMVIAMGLSPLWPAYGEAISRADHAWVKTAFIRSLSIAMGMAATGAFLVALAGPALLRLWVGPSIHATPLLLIGFAIWKVIESGGNSVAMLLNGAHVVRFQLIVSTITGVAVLALKFLLVKHIGIPGTVFATITGYLIFSLVPNVIKVRSILNSTPDTES